MIRFSKPSWLSPTSVMSHSARRNGSAACIVRRDLLLADFVCLFEGRWNVFLV
jgi:hypothetical protein